MRARLLTAGEQVAIRCEVPWVADRLVEGTDGRLVAADEDDGGQDASVLLHVERRRDPFHGGPGWVRLARDTFVADGTVVVRDVVTSGFDMRLRWRGPVAEVAFRHRPPSRTRAANGVLRGRGRLLVRAALLQYPVLWVAAARGRAPVHASACTLGGAGATLLVGPSGVGKTTLVEEEVAAGGSAASDNLGVSDGETLWGLVEPVRSERAKGRSAPHGRREGSLGSRVAELRPRSIVLLRRGDRLRVEPCDRVEATRAMVASTYAAGELRRYWALHALLALGSGTGPAHPPVADVAAGLAAGARCLTVELPHVRGTRLRDVLATEGVTAWS